MKRLIYLLAISLIVFTSCKKEEVVVTEGNAFETLTDYLIDNNMDIDKVISAGWVTPAPAVAETAAFIGKYNIIDIRSSADFSEGHIEGAVNTTLANILTTADAFTTDKPILVVCYTGQTAGRAVTALRLSGYTDATVLKFGMCGWTTALPKTDKWANAILAETANGHANWVASPGSIKAVETFEYPNIETTATTGAAILEEQIEKMLSNTEWITSSTAVLTAPETFFINNLWKEENVATYGNIVGAYRINPLTLANDNIANLDPSKTVITYCWTGQTSSMMTAYLNVIGYNAKSLGYGANNMIHNDLVAHEGIIYHAPETNLPTVKN